VHDKSCALDLRRAEQRQGLGLNINPKPLILAELSSVGEWIIDIASLAIMGVGSAMVLVPSIPLMRDGFEQGGGLGDPTDAISSLYSAAWSLGELIGPPFGGTLLEMMPTREELNCAKPSKDCVWSYYSALTVFSGILGFFAVMMAFLIRESQEGGQDSSESCLAAHSFHEKKEGKWRRREE
jgi:MFS family permease